jgi:hypothetical protein
MLFEFSCIIEGATEKVYIFHTAVLYHYVKLDPLTCHFPNNQLLFVLYEYNKFDALAVSFRFFLQNFIFSTF